MSGRAAAVALMCALLAQACSVARLPETAATGEQTATQHRLDAADCKAEVGYRHNYNGDDSPLANALRNVFVLGTSGAALGGCVDGQRRADRGRRRGRHRGRRDQRERVLPLRAGVDRLHGEPRLPDRCDPARHQLR